MSGVRGPEEKKPESATERFTGSADELLVQRDGESDEEFDARVTAELNKAVEGVDEA